MFRRHPTTAYYIPKTSIERVMANHDVKACGSSDLVAGANTTLRDELASPEHFGREKDLDTSATTSSSTGATEPSSVKAQKAPWLRWLNPLKKNRPPPPPNQQKISREYDAGLFSLLTWQLIAPLMTVRQNCWSIAMGC